MLIEALALVSGGIAVAGWFHNQWRIRQLERQQENQRIVNLSLFLIIVVILLVVIDVIVLVYFLNNNTPNDSYASLFQNYVKWIFNLGSRKSWDNQTVLIIALGILLHFIQLLIVGLFVTCIIRRRDAVVPLINMHIGDNNYCSAVVKLSVGAAAVAFVTALAVYRYLPI